ncbi:MAG: T9SS type A sorting domain-containing protein [Saprospiraceae bacterium]|nr:T9SS type A sorting domain-containing protein [Saprospiraceae bacterium]
MKTHIYQPIENVEEDHHCGTMKRYNAMMQSSPAYRQSRQQIDNHAKKFATSARKENLSGGVIVIPVVFHVIYNPSVPAQNISDDQIKAQIKQLNDDYRRTNSDRTATPNAFLSAANDMEIQFCLATRDPNGNATTGITRHSYSSPTSWTETNFDATPKPATIWDRDKYLNLWSANLGNSLLGYAQFPGDIASTDGVVLLYSSVGSIDKPGTVADFAYGRTASHEVGHWLNLYHIWGDDSGACTGSDQVNDTPNQTSDTNGCGTFPETDACTTTSPGVMYMNYMDYSFDNCLNMFTSGQKDRMVATLNGVRSSLLTSNGCTPLTPDYAVNASAGTYATCAGSTITYTVLTTAFNSYATNISLATSDVPAGCTANLSSSTVSPGGSASITLNIGSGVAAGFYSFWLKTTSGASNPDSVALTFNVHTATLSGTPTPIIPANNATGQSVTPLFTWNTVANATAYDFQLSTTANFSNIILTQSDLTTNSAFVPTGTPLSNVTTYYWRVLAKNPCTSTAYATGSFTTGTITCMTFNNDSTKTISASGTPLVRSYIKFPHSGTITDINVTKLTGTHTYVTDLIVRLRSPTSTDVTLISEPCDGETNFSIGFDDQTTNSAGSYPCPPTDGLLYQPSVFLTNFNGAQANGVWMLMIRDTFAQDGGSLTGWGLRVCVNNIVIPVEMVDFKAKPFKNRIQLNWQTAAEQNNKGFEIQRSIDPLSSFTTIGFVKGQGNSSKLTDYQYSDENVRLGTTYYYRLRQLDFEGKEMFSKVEAANLDLETVWDIAIEPNPTESVLNVEILGKVKQAISLDLYSIDGKLLLSKTIQTDHTKVALDLAPLSSGIYMLKCHAGTNYFVKKVVKK